MNHFQIKGKLEAKYTISIKKILSLFVTLTKYVFDFFAVTVVVFFFIAKKENTKSTI